MDWTPGYRNSLAVNVLVTLGHKLQPVLNDIDIGYSWLRKYVALFRWQFGDLTKLNDLFVIVLRLYWRSQCDVTQVLTSFRGTSCQAEAISQKIPLGDYIKDADPTLLITSDQVKVLFFVFVLYIWPTHLMSIFGLSTILEELIHSHIIWKILLSNYLLIS